jgi:hypothetical protein
MSQDSSNSNKPHGLRQPWVNTQIVVSIAPQLKDGPIDKTKSQPQAEPEIVRLREEEFGNDDILHVE